MGKKGNVVSPIFFEGSYSTPHAIVFSKTGKTIAIVFSEAGKTILDPSMPPSRPAGTYQLT
jgi:hypothetical protein